MAATFLTQGGHHVAFETHTKLLSQWRPTQAGLIYNAKGTYGGKAFEVDEYDDLLYCNLGYATRYLMPDLAVKFEDTDGICGIALRAEHFSKEEIPYYAQLLGCDGTTIEEVKVVSLELPPGFGPL